MTPKQAYQAKASGAAVCRIFNKHTSNPWKGKVGKITEVRTVDGVNKKTGRPFRNITCSVTWDDGAFGNHPARVLERLPDPSCFNHAVRGKRRMRI